MRALGEHGLPVPEAIDQNRHCVVMSIIEAKPLSQVYSIKDPAKVYKQIMENMVKLAKLGLVHCDFNEFNIMIDEKEDITVIDFPQMVSIKHENAASLFTRDVDCIVKFFNRKVKYSASEEKMGMFAYPTLEEIMEDMNLSEDLALDKQLAASGFKGRFDDDGSDSDEEEEESLSDPDGGAFDGSSSEEEGGEGGERGLAEERAAGDGATTSAGKAAGPALGALTLEDSGAEGGQGEGQGGGDLDGLLQFAQSYDEQESAPSEATSHSSRQRAHGGGGAGKPRSKHSSNKPRGKTNANKDRSGKRHAGAKHKMKISRSDY